MSWDISIQDLPASAVTLEEIPDDFQPSPLGPRSEVIARILQAVPGVDFTDPSWGMLQRDSFSIEFNMGPEEICTGFMLHVRGGADDMQLIGDLLKAMNLRGIDCQTSEFFTVDAGEESFSEWRQFRDRVVSDGASGPS